MHNHAKNSIWSNYLKPNPLLGKEFSLMFHISNGRIKKFMQDVMGTSISIFSDVYHRNIKSAASLEACLLMPIKTLAYGNMSEEFGRRACKEFDAAIKQCYMDEFLHIPTAADIKSVVKLHKSQHNFEGIFGSLNCTHTYWKNCPKACFIWVHRNIE